METLCYWESINSILNRRITRRTWIVNREYNTPIRIFESISYTNNEIIARLCLRQVSGLSPRQGCWCGFVDQTIPISKHQQWRRRSLKHEPWIVNRGALIDSTILIAECCIHNRAPASPAGSLGEQGRSLSVGGLTIDDSRFFSLFVY